MDPTIYRLTFTYLSMMGSRLPCTMTSEMVIEGYENVQQAKAILAEAGITEVITESWHAPPFEQSLRALKASLVEYPVRSRDV